MHKHSFKQTGGGCMVRGGEKYPCDIDYECECREKFTLLTTSNGFTQLPERFTTQPKSETHQETLNSINEAVIGGELSMTPESRPPFKDLADFVAAPPEKKEEAMLKVARAATNDQRAQIGLPPLQEETECCPKCYDVYYEKDYPAHTALEGCIKGFKDCPCHKPRTPLPRKGPNAARFVKGLEKIAQRNLYPQSEAEKPNQ